MSWFPRTQRFQAGASLLDSLVKAVGKIRTIPAFLAATKDLGEVLCLEAPSFSSR